MTLKIDQRKSGTTTVLQLVGDIDATSEHALTGIHKDLVGATQIQFDLGRIERINSIGLSFFVQFVKSLLAKAPVRFVHCPSVFVDYLNILNLMKKFGAGISVESVLVPVSCKKCDTSGTVAVTFPRPDPLMFVEAQRCPTCSGAFTAEVDLDDFFHFTL